MNYVVKCVLFFLLLFSIHLQSNGQESTTIGGYGNLLYRHNSNLKTSMINYERFVLFVEHTFTDKISMVSELEIEDAKISGGDPGGEFALEQAYVKFNLDQDHYFAAGLFIPRIGILNENHLPNTFNGNERTQVETYIIPATWRELGIGFYGGAGSLPLNYSVALVNGLNSDMFAHGTGIREGRAEGKDANANNLALTSSVQFYQNDIKAQVSGYYGGTVGLPSQQANNLSLSAGPFGTPVLIGEADIQYEVKGLSAKLLGAVVSIPNADNINNAFANNTPQTEYGAYAEIAYNLLEKANEPSKDKLLAFVRFETLDMNAIIPSNGIIDGTLRQRHIIIGVGYLPINNVVIKADVRFASTGEENPALPVNPGTPYEKNNTFINLGLGFSF